MICLYLEPGGRGTATRSPPPPPLEYPPEETPLLPDPLEPELPLLAVEELP